MKQFRRLFLLGVSLFFLLLPTKPAAQTPAKMASTFLTEQAAADLQRQILSATLTKTLGESVVTSIPPITVQHVVHHGEIVPIVPKEDLRRQVDFLTRNQTPIPVAYAYTRELQRQFSNRENFFETLAIGYYKRNFAVATPNIIGVIERISSLKNPALEKRFLGRMQELISYRAQIAAQFPKVNARNSLRIRYLNDIDTLTAANFQESKLVISVEQHLQPSSFRTLFPHIRGSSTFTVGKDKTFRVYNYNGPVDYIPHLYRYLVTANDLPEMTLVLNTSQKSLFLYNYDKSIWLRVTPHEYTRPKHLHVHLNRLVSQEVTLGKKTHYEPVLINLSIPIKDPVLRLTEPNLYRAFIINPFNHFKDNPHVTVTVK